MRQNPRAILATSILAVLLGITAPVYAQHAGHDTPATATAPTPAQASSAQRDLWLGHAFWVRNVAVETLSGNTAAAKAAENEVVTNARQIAASIEPFYGKAASDKLFGLLAGHYGAVKQYIDATAAGSQARQDAAMKQMADNVNEIATFLSGANPNLPYDSVRSLLLAHGGHHAQEIQQLHDRQYQQEAQTWAAMKDHMYVIADALAGALVKQFPAKFG